MSDEQWNGGPEPFLHPTDSTHAGLVLVKVLCGTFKSTKVKSQLVQISGERPGKCEE